MNDLDIVREAEQLMRRITGPEVDEQCRNVETLKAKRAIQLRDRLRWQPFGKFRVEIGWNHVNGCRACTVAILSLRHHEACPEMQPLLTRYCETGEL